MIESHWWKLCAPPPVTLLLLWGGQSTTSYLQNCPRLAYNQYTSARIVFSLNLMCLRFSFDAFLETRMWRICDRNETRDQERNGRSRFHYASDCFVPVHAHIHETLSTILVGMDGLIKTGSLRISEISSSATPDWTLHREWFGHEILFLQLCRYISMTYSINGGMSELSSTHDKTGDMDYTRVTDSKGCVDSRVLGSSAMHSKCIRTSWRQVKLWSYWSFRGLKKKERKKEKRNRLTCHLCDRIIILKTGFLLEWSFRCCLRPVCNLHQFRLLRRDRNQFSSLCGGKLLGLCPYPLLVVHPVLTETQNR